MYRDLKGGTLEPKRATAMTYVLVHLRDSIALAEAEGRLSRIAALLGGNSGASA